MSVELLFLCRLTSDNDYNNLTFLHCINSQSDSFRRRILTYNFRADLLCVPLLFLY